MSAFSQERTSVGKLKPREKTVAPENASSMTLGSSALKRFGYCDLVHLLFFGRTRKKSRSMRSAASEKLPMTISA
jgi:hypothetical protein